MGTCTKPNCDCAEKEMQKQGTELIKSYPCLNADTNADELKSDKMISIEEIKEKYLKSAKRTICWSPMEIYKGRGGQTVGLSPSGVYLESEETGFCIFISHNRSQLKNAELAYTFFQMYLDETIK